MMHILYLSGVQEALKDDKEAKAKIFLNNSSESYIANKLFVHSEQGMITAVTGDKTCAVIPIANINHVVLETSKKGKIPLVITQKIEGKSSK